uniref:TNFR-Cys domain-containing protein n=1 Tax=Maylandia zebra TaxID=106582 RepID=A0A3P9C0L4_9CICH
MFSFISIIVMTVFSGLSLTCHPGEYQIGNECCPKCPPGSQVKTHCKEYSSRSCAPCMGGTYTDQQNGLERCLSCTNCDSGSGLRVKTPCTSTSDTVCEPLERFYCVSYEKDSCRRAQEHRHCKPGQYIRQNGTASTDTECSDCSSGTFSNGTFHSLSLCPSRCHSLNLQLITEGTLAADNQCGEKSNHVTPTITVIVLIIVGLVISAICQLSVQLPSLTPTQQMAALPEPGSFPFPLLPKCLLI